MLPSDRDSSDKNTLSPYKHGIKWQKLEFSDKIDFNNIPFFSVSFIYHYPNVISELIVYVISVLYKFYILT